MAFLSSPAISTLLLLDSNMQAPHISCMVFCTEKRPKPLCLNKSFVLFSYKNKNGPLWPPHVPCKKDNVFFSDRGIFLNLDHACSMQSFTLPKNFCITLCKVCFILFIYFVGGTLAGITDNNIIQCNKLPNILPFIQTSLLWHSDKMSLLFSDLYFHSNVIWFSKRGKWTVWKF